MSSSATLWRAWPKLQLA